MLSLLHDPLSLLHCCTVVSAPSGVTRSLFFCSFCTFALYAVLCWLSCVIRSTVVMEECLVSLRTVPLHMVGHLTWLLKPIINNAGYTGPNGTFTTSSKPHHIEWISSHLSPEQFPKFTQNAAGKLINQHLKGRRSEGRNVLVMGEVRRECPKLVEADRKALQTWKANLKNTNVWLQWTAKSWTAEDWKYVAWSVGLSISA